MPFSPLKIGQVALSGAAFFLVIAFLNSAGAMGKTIPSKGLQVEKNNFIAHVLEVYRKFPTVKSKFTQITGGEVSYGWLLLDRSRNSARIEYDQQPLRIIINHNTLLFEQTDLNEKTFIPLVKNPLKYVVSNNTQAMLNSVSVQAIQKLKDTYVVAIKSALNTFSEKLFLVFNASYYLTGWIIVTATGQQTTVSLSQPIFGTQQLPTKIFNTHRVVKISYKGVKIS